MGRDYLDETIFQGRGLRVIYNDFHHPTYPQHHQAPFTPYLAAIDLLFNCGPAAHQVLANSGPVQSSQFRVHSSESPSPKAETPNSEPETPNPEPGTPNSEPGTRNPEPGTRNSEPGTRNSP